MAFDLCLELIKSRTDVLDAAGILSESADIIARYRGNSAAEAETMLTLGHPKVAHEHLAAAFMFRFKYQLLALDHDEALKDGQGVLNNLVAAKTGSLNFQTVDARQEHEILCSWLRCRVQVAR
jgi:hypothetical protein